ncbi:MAG: serine O-acetyltransferase EpsC [Planctomycetaceae bacterium]
MNNIQLSADTISPFDADWKIEGIVTDLRLLRKASLSARCPSGQPTKLPLRKSLAAIVESLSAALFPNRLGSRQLTEGSVDFFVGHTIDVALRELCEQVLIELHFLSGSDSSPRDQCQQAHTIVRDFAAGLPDIRRSLETDIEAAYEGDPAARSRDEILACYPGITAIIHHRQAHLLYLLGLPLIARIIAELAHSTTGIDIHPGAKIGGYFFIDHGTGVVIGETAVIGERVRLYHGVTLGAKRFAIAEDGSLVKGNARHPIVEDDVVVYAGATILGRVTIGRGSVIGGNVWLTHSVPPGSYVTQAKSRNEAFDDGSGI